MLYFVKKGFSPRQVFEEFSEEEVEAILKAGVRLSKRQKGRGVEVSADSNLAKLKQLASKGLPIEFKKGK